ncbi:mitochondrial ribosomal subunit protein-domain-containing protein [Fomitopsis betulina]|nr:mitochondrial ribosomal subunit protein-domain-containing protein [Fomitopsis betulina]
MFAARTACRAFRPAVLRSNHHFHTSAAVAAKRTVSDLKIAGSNIEGYDSLDDECLDDDGSLDTSSAGHIRLQQQRRVLYYWRLIEHEMPNLVAYRKPFVPPSAAAPLVVRSITYGGEDHPATLKRAITVPISRLPLKDKSAVHKFKVLAGPRWTLEPPANSGISPLEQDQEHGYITISCEDFPMAAQNMKWASDALDRLLTEANNTQDSFEDIPLDTRHIEAKKRKDKKGEHLYDRSRTKPTLRDFPKEWLPAMEEITVPHPTTSQ